MKKTINQTIFREYDIRGSYPAEIDERVAYALGLAFAKLMKIKKIAVGRDARPESEKVFWPLAAGLSAGGLKINDLGVCATPELFFAVGAKKFPSGVMVTASHSPAGQTGFKFCDGRGRVLGLKTGLKKLITLAEAELNKLAPGVKLQPQKKQINFLSIAEDYKKFALSFIKPAEAAGFKLILDASSGSGGHLADVIFRALPLKFEAINFRPNDQRFRHGLNPLLAENQLAVKNLVKTQQADLGIIFDGDADRLVFIDEWGEAIPPYYINCLLAEIILGLKPGSVIVADARLNLAIVKAVADQGGKILVQRSGYANFIKTMTEKKLLFGCENSGHVIINFALKKKQQYVYGDVLIPALLILKHLKKNKLTLSQAVKPFAGSYAISGELNFPAKDFSKLAARIRRAFPTAKFSKLDGLSARDPKQDWFFNVRPSHTEPLVRVNIEAGSNRLVNQLKKKLLALIK